MVARARLEGLHRPERGGPRPGRHRGQPLDAGDAVEGKTWLYPLYNFVYPASSTRTLLQKAGLDPSSPPTTLGADHLAGALEKSAPRDHAVGAGPQGRLRRWEIVAAGQLERQGSTLRRHQAEDHRRRPREYAEWQALDDKRSFDMKPYFNADANSLTFAEGLRPLQYGKTAMVVRRRRASSRRSRPCSRREQRRAPDDAGVHGCRLGRRAREHGEWLPGDPVVGEQGSCGSLPGIPARAREPGRPSTRRRALPDHDELGFLARCPARPTSRCSTGSEQNNSIWWSANYTPGRPRPERPFVVFQKMMAGEIDVNGAPQTARTPS